jgi:hypothetical protein
MNIHIEVLLLIGAMKVAKNQGAFLLSHRGAPLRVEPSRRECVVLARLAHQPTSMCHTQSRWLVDRENSDGPR